MDSYNSQLFEIAKNLYSAINEILKIYSVAGSVGLPFTFDQLYKSEIVSLIHILTLDGHEKEGVDFLNRLMSSKNSHSELKDMKTIIESLRAEFWFERDDSLLTPLVFAFEQGLIGKKHLRFDGRIFGKIILSYEAICKAYLATFGFGTLFQPLLSAWISRQNKIITDLLNTGRYDAHTDKGQISMVLIKRDDLSYTVSFEQDDDEELTEKTSPFSELDALIGLGSIKNDVKDLISLVKMQQLRKAQGLTSVPVSLHLVFTGNPGTGKTTVARILAKLYKEIGVLKTGQLVEVDRSDLVAGYVGQTAIKTQEKIKEAMGGILFIDEAYTLAKEGNDFGQEAIDTIIKTMEDHRDEFVVIVAGYYEPMQKFINSNPGLRSRFNKYIHFPDYTAEELVEIFEGMVEKFDYTISEDAINVVTNKIKLMKDDAGENFANARSIRNLFEQIITRQATRVSRIDSPTKDELLEIKIEDLG